jgi:serine/threonine-protein kinase
MPVEPAASVPALWTEPRWKSVPHEANADEQLRYAQLQAPREQQAAAWLAVPGFFPQARESSSKAYAQLVRHWYRAGDVDSLNLLESELARWDAKRQKELLDVLRIGISLRTRDIKEAVRGFERMAQPEGKTPAEIQKIYDPALVSMSLELCMDALLAVQKSEAQAVAEPLRRALRQLVWQLYRLETSAPAGAGRLKAVAARPGG